MSTDFFKQLSAEIRPVRLIRVLWLAPFLLTLSTVFIVSDDLAGGVVSGKYFWFYGSMGLVGLATLIQTIIYRCSFRFSAIDRFALLFAAAVYLSTCLFNNAALNTTKLTILTLLVVLYFSFRLIINAFNRKDVARHILCLFLIFTGLVEAILGLLQLYGFIPSQHSLFKLTGSFFNPGPYAGYLAVVFPLALHFVLRPSPLAFRWASAITCIVILLVLPAAMSRAAWLAVVAGSGVILIGKRHAKGNICVNPLNLYHLRASFRCLLIFVAIALVCAASAGMYFLKKDSADGRALTWKISLQTIAKHPFGVGLGNFSGAYGEIQAAYFASGQASETEELVAGNPEYGFNEYLQIAVESGIIALLLFIGIIIFAVRSMIKARNWGMLGSLIALLVFAGFSYPFSVLPFLIVLVFPTSAAERHADDSDWKDLRRSSKNSPKGNICINLLNLRYLRAVIFAGVCLLVTAGCLYRQYPVYQAYKQWKNNQIYYYAGLYKDIAESCVSLYPYLNDQIRFLFEYAQCLSKSEQPEKSNAVLKRAVQISCDPMLYNIKGKNCQVMKHYKEAETALIKSTQLVPSRLYPWYLLTKLYVEMGWNEKAAETAKIVLTKEPKVQSPAVREMREEVKQLKIKD